MRTTVTIAQKTVTHPPLQKGDAAFITMLAGAHGLLEVNPRRRSDPAVHTAFGRTACAEQSVGQETLEAGTAANVTHLEQALETS